MDTTLIHEICRVLDVKEKKQLVIKLQKYEEGAKLRDMERQLLTKISKMMVSAGIINTENDSTVSIEKEIDDYLLSNYGVKFHGDGTAISLKRQLKLEEIFKKDY